jgi:hypothetical protein
MPHRQPRGTIKAVQTPKEENTGGAELTRRCWDLALAYVVCPCWSSGPRGVELFGVVVGDDEGTDKDSDKELDKVLSRRNKSLSKSIFELKYKSILYSVYSTGVYYGVRKWSSVHKFGAVLRRHECAERQIHRCRGI